MQNLSSKFATMVKAIMVQKQMSQEDLRKKMSKAAGYEIKKSFISRTLSGTTNATLQSVALIATALEIELEFTYKQQKN